MPFDIIQVIRENRALEKVSDPEKLKKEAVAYSGQLKTYRSESGRVYLRQDPLSARGEMLEFKTQDILFAEELRTVTGHDGTAYPLYRLWVKKGAVGIKMEPFLVSDFSAGFDPFQV